MAEERILISPSDGKCSACQGQLEVTGVDDVSLDTECVDCGETYHVESDAYNDGGIDYWPRAMVKFWGDEDPSIF